MHITGSGARRTSLVALAGALAAAAALTGPVAAATGAKPAALRAADVPATPDIVVVMFDDLDNAVWQNALDRGLLPRIQADVIDQGTTFDNTFVALSVCCPSRSTYFTGQYPHNHGVLANVGPKGGFDAFVKGNDASTLAVWMRNAGYRTALMGKYLNGYGNSTLSGGGTYVPPGWDVWRALGTSAQFNYYLSVQGTLVKYGSAETDYQTDVLAREASGFIAGTDPAVPLFLTVTPTAPHYEGKDNDDDSGGHVTPAPRHAATPALETIPPEALPSYNEPDMTDKPAWMRSLPPLDPVAQRSGFNSKVAAIRAVDDLVGTVVDQLKATGRWDRTLLIVTSDNGFQYGTHRKTQKTDLYEESIRVPMVIHAPGQSTARRVGAWVQNVDWAATIVAAGAATPDRVLDGVSLMPWIDGGTGPSRLALLVEHPNDGTPNAKHPPYSMIRSRDPAITGDPTGQVTLVYAETLDPDTLALAAREFYDLSVDPLQTTSLHDSRFANRQKQMSTLAKRLAALRKCKGAACVIQ